MLEMNFDEPVCLLVSHVSYTYIKLLKSLVKISLERMMS